VHTNKRADFSTVYFAVEDKKPWSFHSVLKSSECLVFSFNVWDSVLKSWCNITTQIYFKWVISFQFETAFLLLYFT